MKLHPILLFFCFASPAASAEIERIWLTHQSNDPEKIVVNWMSDHPEDSVVRFGLTNDYGETMRVDENTTLHHVEIPLKR